MEEEKRCPACGKPTAGYVPCPHCGADPSLRLSIKAVAALCIVALIIGSGYLILHVSTLGPRPMLIADINSWYDYASVWLEGTVISGPIIDDRSVSFDLSDGSGDIEVNVYVPPGELKAQDKVPMVGDNALVFGMLRVYTDSKEIRVQKVEDLQITPAQPVSTTIDELKSTWYDSQSLKYKRVTLEGMIVGMRTYYSAKVYTLQDNENKDLDMYVHNGLVYVENRQLDLKLLQTIRVTAGALEYYGPELALASYDDIEVIENGVPTSAGIENIDENMRGQFVRTGGRIIFVEMVGVSNSLGVQMRYFWLDSKDNPPVWISESIYKLLPDNTRELLRRGATAELTGRISSSGELQIELVGPPELSLEDGVYEPPLVENVANISIDNLAEFVTVQGEVIASENVVAVAKIPSNWEFTLRDNFNENIKIWIPNTIYERMIEPPRVGDNLRVVGKVIKREGEIQVQPGLPSDVVRVS